MKKVLQVLGALFIVVLLGVGGLLLYKGGSKPDKPQVQQTIKSDDGTKVTSEAMGFYYKNTLLEGRVYRPSDGSGPMPAIVFCQSIDSGKPYARELAARGFVVYSFDFASEDSGVRVSQLKEVVKQVSGLRYVNSSKLFLIGAGSGSLTACNFTFDNPRAIKGLILFNPGFNPLEISRKAKSYSGQILVVDVNQGMKTTVQEILEYTGV